MKHNLAVLSLSLWMVAGCQTQTTEPPAAVPVGKPVANVTAALGTTQPGAAKPAEPSADTRAESAAKLAAVHAAEIEAMAAKRPAGHTGVTPIDPPTQGQPTQSPAGQTAKSDVAFKPIPAPPKDIAAAIAAHVSLTPVDGGAASPDATPAVGETPTTAAQPAGQSPAQPSAPAAAPVVMSQSQPQPAVSTLAMAESPSPAVAPVDTLESRLQRAAQESPADLSVQIDLQLFKFLKNDPVPSSDAMAGLQGEDRDVLTAVIDGLSNFRNAIRKDNNLLISRKIRPLTDMADRLKARSDLTISNPAICKSILGWGVYDPITPLRLPAGVDNSPGLYYEIENFSPRLTPANMWETRMRQDVAIYDDRGGLVWQWPNEAVVDLCRNRRHDFFFAKRVKTPIKLPVGSYIVKISLTDAIAGRVAETSLPLQMYSPSNSAGPTQGPVQGPPR